MLIIIQTSTELTLPALEVKNHKQICMSSHTFPFRKTDLRFFTE